MQAWSSVHRFGSKTIFYFGDKKKSFVYHPIYPIAKVLINDNEPSAFLGFITIYGHSFTYTVKATIKPSEKLIMHQQHMQDPPEIVST